MKHLFSILVLFLIVLASCKTEKKAEPVTPEKNLTILENVAYAHGFENWKNIKKLGFTFNVDRDTSHFERRWIWDTKLNLVTAITSSDTITYSRKDMDSTTHKTNGGFINDKFWLMAPYNLVWDKDNFTYEHIEKTEAPISKKTMQKLTIVYKNEGGYTPGDAYEFFFGDDYMVKEWVFRRGNQAEPSMTTTWEEYVEKDGLKIARIHQTEDGSFKLHFTDIETTTN
ncbi:hypothetical protein GGR42_001199 [Saonia flava]|uniref:Uncharacterized protein n=1 Tax=Saonia flava TaxID=523696 RepID=A0A846QU31_9FLAO|nr:hypothetical protein [Saonia flava]NJB70737.1 hypothetical protein [Saonia flava]